MNFRAPIIRRALRENDSTTISRHSGLTPSKSAVVDLDNDIR
jgi:hypothetical protein